MFGGSSSRNSKKRIPEEEWEQYKAIIEFYYLDEGKDVKEVQSFMRLNYGFEAHEKAYKRKFDDWGFVKNIPKEEGLFMVQKRENRRRQGRETVFHRRRRAGGPLQLVSDDKIDRIADRYAADLARWPEDPGTPDNIEYSSGEEGSGHQHQAYNNNTTGQASTATTTQMQWTPEQVQAYYVQQQQQQYYGGQPAAAWGQQQQYAYGYNPADPATWPQQQ